MPRLNQIKWYLWGNEVSENNKFCNDALCCIVFYELGLLFLTNIVDFLSSLLSDDILHVNTYTYFDNQRNIALLFGV